MPVVAVTGATGYVGSLIVEALRPEATVVKLVRRCRDADDIAWCLEAPPANLADALRERGVSHLVHAAWDMRSNARADIMRSCVAGSSALLSAAQTAGIERPIFISTVSAFPGARSVYGQSKHLVEDMVLRERGLVLRLGLVYGQQIGGVFAGLKNLVSRLRFVPMIGDGNAVQYPLHESTLAIVIRRAIRGEFDSAEQPLVIAQPEGISFKTLLRTIAAAQHKQIVCVPVPWWAVYWGLRCAEALGLRLGFRSDSVVSFRFPDSKPDFSALAHFCVDPVRFKVP